MAQRASDVFATAVRGSHRVRIRCEIWSAAGVQLATVYPTGGSVTVDARRGVRRNLSITLIDTDGTLTPKSPNDALAPFAGNEIYIWRGITYGDGTTEEVPLGVFRIVSVDVSRGPEGITLDVSGEDRAWTISRRTLTSVLTISSGTLITDALTTILTDRYPLLATPTFTPTTFTTPQLTPGADGQTDPWDYCRQLANAAGHELYFAADGTLTTSPIPNLASSPSVATFAEGADGVTLDLSRSLSIDGIVNTLTVSAEGTQVGDLTWSSTAQDTDPLSPTNVTSAYGIVKELISTPFPLGSPTDTGQTDYMASSLLQTYIGQPFDMTVIPNPTLDVRDVIRVQSPRLGIDTVAMIDAITIPLDPTGTSSITARARSL